MQRPLSTPQTQVGARLWIDAETAPEADLYAVTTDGTATRFRVVGRAAPTSGPRRISPGLSDAGALPAERGDAPGAEEGASGQDLGVPPCTTKILDSDAIGTKPTYVNQFNDGDGDATAPTTWMQHG